MKFTQRFILYITTIEAIVFSVFIWFAMFSAGWFRIDFYSGGGQFQQGRKTLTEAQIHAINSLVVIDVVYAIGAIILLAELHRYLQGWLTRLRPEGTAINPIWGWADLITSFLPVFAAILAFWVSRLMYTFPTWWWYVQGLNALIIAFAVREDLWPSLKYFRKNWKHMKVKLAETTTTPASGPVPPSAVGRARTGSATTTPVSATASSGSTSATAAASPTPPTVPSGGTSTTH